MLDLGGGCLIVRSDVVVAQPTERRCCLDAGFASDMFSLWEPGLPAMQAPRSSRMTEVLPSRASPLPPVPVKKFMLRRTGRKARGLRIGSSQPIVGWRHLSLEFAP